MLQAKMERKKTSRVFLIMQHAGEVCLRLVARVCICQLHPEVTRADYEVYSTDTKKQSVFIMMSSDILRHITYSMLIPYYSVPHADILRKFRDQRIGPLWSVNVLEAKFENRTG